MKINLSIYPDTISAIHGYIERIEMEIDDYRDKQASDGLHISKEYQLVYDIAKKAELSPKEDGVLEHWAHLNKITREDAVNDIIQKKESFDDLLLETRRIRLDAKHALKKATSTREAHAIYKDYSSQVAALSSKS